MSITQYRARGSFSLILKTFLTETEEVAKSKFYYSVNSIPTSSQILLSDPTNSARSQSSENAGKDKTKMSWLNFWKNNSKRKEPLKNKEDVLCSRYLEDLENEFILSRDGRFLNW